MAGDPERECRCLPEAIDSYRAGVRGRRRHLATRLRQHGALVSEYEPGIPAKGWMFAKRNATIAAPLRLAPPEAATLLAAALLRGEVVLTCDGRVARR